MSSPGRKVLAALLVCTMAVAGPAMAALNGILTVRWDPNTTDADLASYRVFLSTDPGVFSMTPAQAAALSTTRVVSRGTTETIFNSLDPARVYWIAVTSIDTSANESAFSMVVSAQPRDTTPPTVSLTSPASGTVLSGVKPVTASAADDVGVSGVLFKVDGSAIGAEDTTSPYAISWDTTTAGNGPHTLTAVARDAGGNTTTSAAVNVTVSNPDTTPPVVSITSPAPGASLQASVSLSATASDNIGVAGVRFRLDGANLGAEDTTSPYAISWDTTTVANGPHTLTAVARDAAGNTATSAAVSVNVNNPDITSPTVSLTAPATGASLQSSVTVSALASDNVGVVGVRFRLDGANMGAEDTTSPYAISWDTTTVGNGPHTLTAVARDAAGNTATSAAVSVTVNNPDTTPPSVSITAPAAGATLVFTVNLTAAAADNVGVAGVQFKLDGANLGAEDTSAPYAISWDTLPVINGPHTLTAVARDAAGNTTTSAAVLVTTSNDRTPPLPPSGVTVIP